LVASPWGYRRKARLGVKYVPKKGKVLVGFRERGSSFVTDLSRCETLHPKVGAAIEALAALVAALSIRDRVPQIEVSMGDGPCVLIFRLLQTPAPQDLARLDAFGKQQGFSIWIQEGGAQSLHPLTGHGVDLWYGLPQYALRLHFQPTDFTQVNAELNRLMVVQALALLDPQPDDQILDLFCGLGNFTLPLAQRAAQVVGVEGEAGLVARGRDNAERNGLHNVRFYTSDLYQPLDQEAWLRERFDKALLDPPRSGALQVLDLLPRVGVRRILYISCYPSTLARDADRLVNVLGYRLRAAGVMDMFPHTAHVESIALFEGPDLR
jgi:23S rRNA (uracil1939-C5)-methyltransferase